MPRKALLEIKGIGKHYGGIQAVQDVSFTIAAGEAVAVVGDNGAGKSTLIKMVSGAVVPDFGEIWFDGKKQHIKTPHDALDLGIETMYQDLSLIPSLGAPANIFLGREPLSNNPVFKIIKHKKMYVQAKELMTRLGITLPSYRAQVEHMSGGQRQAVALAKAFVKGDPKLLIMDEPTAALGVEEQKKVLNLIEKLKETTGVTIIIISHNLDHVLAVSERILVMKGGKLVADLEKKKTTKDKIAQAIITGSLSQKETV